MHFAYPIQKKKAKKVFANEIIRIDDNANLDIRTNKRIYDFNVYNKIYISFAVTE